MRELLTTREAARVLKTRPSCLENWRWKGQGPRYIKVGRMVRYRPEDLASWVEERSRRSTSDPGSESR